MSAGIGAINEEVQRASAFVQPLFAELNKVIIGQRYLLERLCIGLLANGHVLLEGVPGLAKTLAVKSLAASTTTVSAQTLLLRDGEHNDWRRGACSPMSR